MRKTKIYTNKPVYLCLSILDLSKTIIYEFWYDYVKPRYDEKAKLCYMDTDSFIVHVNIYAIYKGYKKVIRRYRVYFISYNILTDTTVIIKD